MLASLFLTCLAAVSSAAPTEKRDADNKAIVQGALGVDSYWNEYDGGANKYMNFKGDGGHDAGWPEQSYWVSFNDMWTANLHRIERGCSEWFDMTNNNKQEIKDLHDAINQVAHETRVDHRYILAIIMQETQGCVRANTDKNDGTYTNTGLLKALDGKNSCNDGTKVTNPCPKDNIVGQIRDGIEGTQKGHGCAEDINAQSAFVKGNVAQAYYRAARLYDSGTVDKSNNLEVAAKGEKCYASDIANRLMGWVDAPSTCSNN